MPVKRGIFFLSLAFGLALSILSLIGFSLLRHRPGFPAGIDRSAIVRVDDVKIQRSDELNFILSQRSVGDRVTVVLGTPTGTESRTVELVAYYSQAPFPFIYLIIGLINLGIGFTVFILKPGDSLARIFFWAAVAFSYSIIVSGEFYCQTRSPATCIPGFIFNVLYPLAPALLIHFCLALSRRLKWPHYLLIYGPAAILAGLIDAFYLGAVIKRSPALFRRELEVVYVFRWYLVAAIGLSLVLLILNLRRSRSREERAQVQWIFYGLAVGLAPFVLLYQLPRILGLAPLLSEDLSSVFYIVIPLAFAIAIVKFGLMRIEIVINRSLVYGFLTILIVSIYLLALEAFRLVSVSFFSAHRTLLSLVAAVILAAVFHPARRRIQGFVDKAFFRQSYDARQAVLRFSEWAQRTSDIEALAAVLESQIAGALPTDGFHLALFDGSGGPDRPRLLRGNASIVEALKPCLAGSAFALARRSAVRFGEGLDFSKEAVLESARMELALPLPFHGLALNGFLALGRKRSGERYRTEDLDLLTALLAEMALHLERIKLQEEVIYERATREKLDEINRLKTEFVSTVSHELRTPLSSLQGLVEMLQSHKLKDEAGREKVLEIMAGESSRLSRLLHNILDYGKIEQNVKGYDLRPVGLQPVVRDALKLIRFGSEARDFVFHEDLPPQTLTLRLDRDAVEQALINLIDNAMKYSGDRKEVEVKVVEEGRDVLVQVRDWGIGIPLQERDRVFEKFYRTAEGGRHNPQGVGLGLKIVKHIMEGHGGSIRVSPAPGQGTIFSLVFPKP